MYIGHVPLVIKILLVVAAVLVLRQLRQRDDGARGRDEEAAMAVVEEVRSGLARLEERLDNLETLLPEASGKRGGHEKT
mgnify:FL=1